MENASKALIIAGAILLAILIISLGILIFSQAQVDEQEIMAFNNKFVNYIGNNKTGSEVNALAQAVLSNNQSASDNGESDTKGITMSGSVVIAGDGTTTSFTRLPSGTRYNVTCTYKNGLINTINVATASGS